MTLFRWAIAAIAIYLAQAVLPSAAQTLSVNTGSSAPLSTPQRDGFNDLIAFELFKRIGRNITIQNLPGERTLINLNRGIDDANFVRIRGIEKAYPNIRIVPEKILDQDFLAFTRDPNVKVKEWAGLKSYSVAFINGWKIFEQNTRQAKFVTRVNTPSQLFDLLTAGRTDVILFERWRGLANISRRHTAAEVRMLSPPLATREMFMYVHKKHEALIDKLAAAIRTMRSDGTFKMVYEKTLAPLLVK